MSRRIMVVMRMGALALLVPTVAAGPVDVGRCDVVAGETWMDCHATVRLGGTNGLPLVTLPFGVVTAPQCGADDLSYPFNPPRPPEQGTCSASAALGVATVSAPTPNPGWLKPPVLPERSIPPLSSNGDAVHLLLPAGSFVLRFTGTYLPNGRWADAAHEDTGDETCSDALEPGLHDVFVNGRSPWVEPRYTSRDGSTTVVIDYRCNGDHTYRVSHTCPIACVVELYIYDDYYGDNSGALHVSLDGVGGTSQDAFPVDISYNARAGETAQVGSLGALGVAASATVRLWPAAAYAAGWAGWADRTEKDAGAATGSGRFQPVLADVLTLQDPTSPPLLGPDGVLEHGTTFDVDAPRTSGCYGLTSNDGLFSSPLKACSPYAP